MINFVTPQKKVGICKTDNIISSSENKISRKIERQSVRNRYKNGADTLHCQSIPGIEIMCQPAASAWLVAAAATNHVRRAHTATSASRCSAVPRT